MLCRCSRISTRWRHALIRWRHGPSVGLGSVGVAGDFWLGVLSWLSIVKPKIECSAEASRIYLHFAADNVVEIFWNYLTVYSLLPFNPIRGLGWPRLATPTPRSYYPRGTVDHEGPARSGPQGADIWRLVENVCISQKQEETVTWWQWPLRTAFLWRRL